MEIQRQLQLVPLLAKKSFFLFGPRATGKTTLVRQQLVHCVKNIALNIGNIKFPYFIV